jgi:demethoxyubiquinone hydroxylase (CLK1/Coq7/Cat5 family)
MKTYLATPRRISRPLNKSKFRKDQLSLICPTYLDSNVDSQARWVKNLIPLDKSGVLPAKGMFQGKTAAIRHRKYDVSYSASYTICTTV